MCRVEVMCEYFIALVLVTVTIIWSPAAFLNYNIWIIAPIITQTMAKNEPSRAWFYSHASSNMDLRLLLSSRVLKCLPTSLLTWCHLLTMTDHQLLVSLVRERAHLVWWNDTCLRSRGRANREAFDTWAICRRGSQLKNYDVPASHICRRHPGSIMAAGARATCPPLSFNHRNNINSWQTDSNVSF